MDKPSATQKQMIWKLLLIPYSKSLLRHGSPDKLFAELIDLSILSLFLQVSKEDLSKVPKSYKIYILTYRWVRLAYIFVRYVFLLTWWTNFCIVAWIFWLSLRMIGNKAEFCSLAFTKLPTTAALKSILLNLKSRAGNLDDWFLRLFITSKNLTTIIHFLHLIQYLMRASFCWIMNLL